VGTRAESLERLRAARLYVVLEGRFADVVPAAIDGGVDVVQLRDKDAGDGELLAASRDLARVCRSRGVLFVVNDRADVAIECGADGVHLGQDDAPVERVRAEAGERLLIGLSTHSPEQVAAAEESSADYFAVGPVHATPTKPGRPAVGVELVRHAAAVASKPWFAIGGLDPGNVAEVAAAGARRVVVVRAIRDAADPEAAARALRSALEAADPGARAGAGIGQAI
jgi:thiamine-phosphate pyrophosphorylase